MRDPHVLIVDDEPEIVLALSLRLRAAGCRVTTAGDGLAAVEACLADPPDLVLLDLVLPAEDGHAVLRRLRGLAGGSPPPVVCLSARTDAATRQRALAAGAVAFVSKPFDGRRLLEIVAAHLAPLPAGSAAAESAGAPPPIVLSGARLSQP